MSLTYRRIKGQLAHDYERLLMQIRPTKKLEFGRISLSVNGMLTIKADYLWDFASGAFDTKAIIEGSLVHDALCELIHNDLLSYHEWDNAAEEMKIVCLENGMWRIRAAWVERALKIAGPEITQSRKYITI